jgi:acyl-CoA thioesterase-1
MRARWQGAKLLLVVLLVACGPPVGDPSGAPNRGRSGETIEVSETRSDDLGDRILIAFLGDSLSAGLGVDEDEAFPKVVEGRLRELGWNVEVINAGVSGDTTAGGTNRVVWLLRQRPHVVVVELGANDGLRGMSIEMTESNLRRMVSTATEAGSRVLLVGMKVPPNYGSDYAQRFEAIFPSLAGELGVSLVPFLLEGVAAEPELNQADGIHPNAAGHRRVAETVEPYLEAILKGLEVSGSPPGS